MNCSEVQILLITTVEKSPFWKSNIIQVPNYSNIFRILWSPNSITVCTTPPHSPLSWTQ